jgi:hypothetical protein
LGNPVVVKVLPPPPRSSEAEKDEAERHQKAAVERGLLYFTVVLAIATLGLMVATIGLVVFAKRTAEETRILQRAYLSANPHGVYSLRVNHAQADVGFQNVGRLPARNARWKINVTANDLKFVPGEVAIDESVPGGVIVPGTEWKQFGRTEGGVITREILNVLGRDKDIELQPEQERYIYVWGAVLYDDGFGTRRRTRFCHRYDFRGFQTGGDPYWPGAMIRAVGFVRYHEHGNDAE